MLQQSRLEKLWSKVATLVAGVSVGVSLWWLSPRGGRFGGSVHSRKLDGVQKRLAEVPGGEQVCVRDLGRGIVEAFGAAPDAEAVSRVLAALREEPGVSFVVNRIWTPASAHGSSSDLTHSPRLRSQAQG